MFLPLGSSIGENTEAHRFSCSGKKISPVPEYAELSMKLKCNLHLEFTNCFNEATENYWVNQQKVDFCCSVNEISFQLSHRLQVCVSLGFSEASPLCSSAGFVPFGRAGQVPCVCG